MTGSFVDLVDLASERLGGAVVAANDEFFAPKERLIMAGAAVWREGEYTERGKWMDGWETRRRRDVGDDSHDWCVIRLGAPGIVRGVDVDTSFFKGNYPGGVRDRRLRSAGPADARRADRARRGARCCRGRRSTGDAHNLVRGRRRAGGDAPAPADFSRRRRRAAARLRRGGRRLGAAAAARRRRSRRRRTRRHRRRVQRHVLRIAAQPDHAGRCDAHGRRVGNQAAPRARPRLDDRPARRRGHDPAGRGRHAPLQGQRARARAASTRARRTKRSSLARPGRGRAVDGAPAAHAAAAARAPRVRRGSCARSAT